MTELNTKKLALTLGILFAAMHAIGVLAISPLMKYWTWAHFVSFQYTMQAFSLGTFVVGIVGAFLTGLVVGWLFAVLYNRL